jgi:hypothetical protein
MTREKLLHLSFGVVSDTEAGERLMGRSYLKNYPAVIKRTSNRYFSAVQLISVWTSRFVSKLIMFQY